jgi:hypothetical protein
MIILDPDRNGCVVWLINPAIAKHGAKTYIRGDLNEVCNSLIKRITLYKKVKNQQGNYVKRLCWADDVYLDISGFGMGYKNIFSEYGLDVVDFCGKNADWIIPERTII